MKTTVAVEIYLRTQIRGDIWRFDRIKRGESSVAKFVEFIEKLVTEMLAELMPALLRGVQLR